MDNGIIVFDPPKCTWKKPAWLTALHMYLSVFYVSSRYLLGLVLARDSEFRSRQYVKRFWQGILYASHTQVKAINRNNVQEGIPYIYMSNHPSLFDIPAILGALPDPVRLIAKAELFKIPLFGKSMLRSGFIRIDRKDRFKAIKQLDEAKEKLKEGVSIAIFPEGTRQRGNELGDFKKGGFHVATQLGFPIVPIWIEGSREILPPESLRVKINQTITVIVGEPIDTSGYSKKDIPELMEVVREKMLALRTK